MELQADPVREVLGELFSLLEAQETQSAAVLQFLLDQGIATEEKLAPYLEQAGNGSSVKWRAARKRMEYLLTPIQKENTDSPKEADKNKNAEQMKAEGTSPAPVDPKIATKQTDEKNKEKDTDKPETEIAASAKAAFANAVPKADNANTQKVAEGASEDLEARTTDKIQESKEQAARQS